MLSIAQVRELLGDEAAGKTDEQIAAIREMGEKFALACVNAFKAQRRAGRASSQAEVVNR